MASDSLSIISLFWNASILVKAIMLILLGISVVSWTLIFQRWQVFNHAQKVEEEFENSFWSGIELNKLYQRITTQRGEERGGESIFVAGFKEFVRLRKQSAQPAVIIEGAQRTMRVAMAGEIDRLEAHLPFLATAGSVSPYIGIFGTVWGIMNSIHELGSVQQASLSMIAPGISEALVATAMGLFASIPAMIAYNRYANRLQSFTNRFATFLEEFTSILHRQAHSHSSALMHQGLGTHQSLSAAHSPNMPHSSSGMASAAPPPSVAREDDKAYE